MANTETTKKQTNIWIGAALAVITLMIAIPLWFAFMTNTGRAMTYAAFHVSQVNKIADMERAASAESANSFWNGITNPKAQ